MKLPTIPGLVASGCFLAIGYCHAKAGEYGAGLVFALLSIWSLSLRVTLRPR